MASQTEILQAIWSLSPGPWVSLPTLSSGDWYNGEMHEPHTVDDRWFSRERTIDYYFSPITYDMHSKGRTRTNVTGVGVLFADLDGSEVKLTPSLPMPNLIVASGTPGHRHVYWFLDRAYPLVEWERHAKGTTEYLGADPGGWDATQVLRVPGTKNHKQSPATDVEATYFNDKYRYRLVDFPVAKKPHIVVANEALPPLPEFTREQLHGVIQNNWGRLTVEEQLLISGRELVRDRSKLIWKLIQNWRLRGMSEITMFALLSIAPFNKWADQPEKLWSQIHK